jgi:uncharacterized protein
MGEGHYCKDVSMAVKMELARVLIRETNDTHVVELREVEGDRVFPILIGLHEAAAIERRIMGQVPPRPQTHDLLASIIAQLGASLERIVINDLRDHTFFAKIMLRRGTQQIEVDSRPSDAIALGAAMDVPIYVEPHVLDEVCRPD